MFETRTNIFPKTKQKQKNVSLLYLLKNLFLFFHLAPTDKIITDRMKYFLLFFFHVTYEVFLETFLFFLFFLVQCRWVACESWPGERRVYPWGSYKWIKRCGVSDANCDTRGPQCCRLLAGKEAVLFAVRRPFAAAVISPPCPLYLFAPSSPPHFIRTSSS